MVKTHEITDKKIWEETVLGRPEANFYKAGTGASFTKIWDKRFLESDLR